jgi:hypothetical protein
LAKHRNPPPPPSSLPPSPRSPTQIPTPEQAIAYLDDDDEPRSSPDEAELEALAHEAELEAQRDGAPDEADEFEHGAGSDVLVTTGPTFGDVAALDSAPKLGDARFVGPPKFDSPHINDTVAQAAVRALDAFMKADEENRKRKGPALRKLPKMSKADEAKLQPKRYRVLEAARIPKGGAEYRLPAGKIVDSREYRIDDLLAYGVKLLPLDPPA